MREFATLENVRSSWGTLSQEQEDRVKELLTDISDALRYEAIKVGKGLDEMIEATPTLAGVAKMVTVDIIERILRQDKSGEPMSQFSESALGYSLSGTYAIPGGGAANAIMNNDLKRLGLKRQKYGVVELWEK
ncbi:MAG: Gp19/Gp15/Gp42 family protein [Bacillota bacterium]|nr:Gp19/Gp15/Gp42 family protein [Bacillota bacterium]